MDDAAEIPEGADSRKRQGPSVDECDDPTAHKEGDGEERPSKRMRRKEEYKQMMRKVKDKRKSKKRDRDDTDRKKEKKNKKKNADLVNVDPEEILSIVNPEDKPQEVQLAADVATDKPKRGKHYIQVKGHFDPEAPLDDSRSLFVSHLAAATTPEDLLAIFRTYPGMVDLRLVTDHNDFSRGFAYVEFDSSESADAALIVNGTKLNGKLMSVRKSDPKKPVYEDGVVFVKGVSTDWAEEEAEAAVRAWVCKHDFSESDIKEVRLPKDQEGAIKGHAYIEFNTPSLSDKFLRSKYEPLGGREVHVAPSIPMKGPTVLAKGRRETRPEAEPEVPKNILFVKNLSFKTNKASLKRAFAKVGAVTRVKIVRDDENRSKGYGFVEFEDEGAATGGLILQGQEIDGRSIVVSKSSRFITDKSSKDPGEGAPMEHVAEGPQRRKKIILEPQAAPEGTPEVDTDQPMKSNDDFRKLLNLA